MKFRAILATFAAATSVLAVSASPAAAAPAPAPIKITNCGQQISRDAYLAKDLKCSTNFGIRLAPATDDEGGASVVASVDLRGHTLQGPGAGTGIVANLYPASAALTLKNGRVKNWGTGVYSSFSSLNVSRVSFENNKEGVGCNSSCKIDQSVFRNNTVGTRAGEASIELTSNVFTGNGVGSVTSGSATGGTYTNNLYSKNDAAVQVGAISGVTVWRNSFLQNTVGVTAIEGQASALIEENLFMQNRDGIYLPPLESVTFSIGRNVTLKNSRYGIYAPGAVDLGDNVATRNGKPCVGVVCTAP